ncbi:unnamed protein product, partial [Heterosigma akashiwo]
PGRGPLLPPRPAQELPRADGAVLLRAAGAGAGAPARARRLLPGPQDREPHAGRPATSSVIDFGLSKPGVHSATAGAKTVCGTPSYLAPETLMRKGYGHAADWWALGILAFELRVGLPPWHEEADDKRRLFRHICLEPVKLPLEVDVSLTF